MTISYTWNITGLKTTDQGSYKDAVVQTYWEKTGVDQDGNTGTFLGATPFAAVDVAPEEFVTFSELSESTVIGWIKQVVVDSYEQHVNDQIQRQIDEKKTNLKESSLPWVNPENT